MTEPNLWDYYRPLEGDHKIHPNELQVGVFSDKGAMLHLVAVLPPLDIREGTHQPTEFAEAVVDDLSTRSWQQSDGVTAWLFAHGFKLAPHRWPPRFNPMTGKNEVV